MCVTAHALLTALVSRLENGGRETTADELRAIIGSGCPREDVEAALARARGAAIEHARGVLASMHE